MECCGPLEPLQYMDGEDNIVFTVADHKHHRPASTLDIFLDLIFVAAIATIGKSFGDIHMKDLSPLAGFASFLSPLFFTWHGVTTWTNRFHREDALTFFCHIATWACLIGASSNLQLCSTPPDPGFHCHDLALFVAFSKVPVLLCWLITAMRTTKGRIHCWTSFVTGLVPFLFFFISSFFQQPAAVTRTCWWGGVASEHLLYILPRLVPIAALRRDGLPINRGWTEERYMQLIVISVGEIVSASVAEQVKTSDPYHYAGMAVFLGISILLFALYFQNQACTWSEQHALHSIVRGGIWVWLHFWALGTIVLTAALLERILEDAEFIFRMSLVVSVSFYLLILSVSSFCHHGSSVLVKFGRALLRLVLFAGPGVGLCFVDLDPVLLCALVLLLLLFVLGVDFAIRKLYLWKTKSKSPSYSMLDDVSSLQHHEEQHHDHSK